MMIFMAWMAAVIAIPVFAPSLPILAWGEAMCGISWGVFQVNLWTLCLGEIISRCSELLTTFSFTRLLLLPTLAKLSLPFFDHM